MPRKARPAITAGVGGSKTPPVEAQLRDRDVLAALRKLRRGEFDVRLPDGLAGADGQLCEAFNDVAGVVQSLADELAAVRAAVDAGQTRRRLAADGLSGGWRRSASDLNGVLDTLQARADETTQVLAAAAGGDFAQRIDDAALRGEFGRQARAVNRVLEQLSSLCAELTRVAREVGDEGKLGTRAAVRGLRGGWRELADAVNLIAASLTVQVREVARVTAAIARGDLGKTVDIEVRGEVLALKTTINAVVQQLGALCSEVARVAQEVSADGRLGGQADVPGAAGVWRELIAHINRLSGGLAGQVRDMAEVTTAVARGDLSRKVTFDARGEILDVKNTVNRMVDQLAVFAAEITRIGRDVATEGILGGQVEVRGVAGIWQDIVDNVNFLARNLTAQVRGIAQVVTAVARGDLAQKLRMDARGEMGALQDNVNHMIRTLAESTRINQEQDWLKTHLTRMTRMLQGHRDLWTVADRVISEVAAAVGAQVGVFYVALRAGDRTTLRTLAAYALSQPRPREFALGEGLIGQVARERRRLLLTEVPPEFLTIESGLARGRPACVVVSPVLFEGEVKAVVELAALQPFTKVQLAFLEQFFESLGIMLASSEAQMRTDELLRRSQELAEELQTQQLELRKANDELARTAEQLREQNAEIEQYIANVSHELRNPLNSLLILSRQLSENVRGNLDERQVQYARTIHQSGSDLLALINEILDLAKLKAGMMRIEPSEVGAVPIAALRDHAERTFRHVAEDRSLAFAVECDESLPPTIVTDEARLKRVLTNLLANAIKFTDHGGVRLTISPVPALPGAAGSPPPEDGFVAFAVEDTGIGIPPEQQKSIFKPFRQGDGSSSRKRGGTGLGLAISLRIACLLGGDLRVESRPGVGSTFTLYVPRVFRSEPARPGEPESPEFAVAEPPSPPAPGAAEPRERARPDERVLLIVADDAALARTLAEQASSRGFCGVIAGDGAQAIDLVQRVKPDALVLDLELPDVDGWALLDRLKHDPHRRHLPVHVITGPGDERRARLAGALAALSRPVSAEAYLASLAELHAFLRRPRRLLVVADDPAHRRRLLASVDIDAIERTATTGGEALAVLARDPYDALLVDGAAGSGLALLEALAERPDLCSAPIVVDGVAADDPRWTQLATRLPIERVAAPDRLLVALTLHLHCPADALPPERREALLRALRLAPTLVDRKVLVVDDEIRNIYSLAAVLEDHGMRVVYAESGQQALERLAEHRDVEVVLMDMMMPRMNGYEAIRRIRARADLAHIPIIAQTGQAMKGDREKCVRAGASDYITKPVDPDQLVSLLRVTLGR